MIWMAPLIALLGLLLYAFASNPKLQRIGEIAYFSGLLAFLIANPVALHLWAHQ